MKKLYGIYEIKDCAGQSRNMLRTTYNDINTAHATSSWLKRCDYCYCLPKSLCKSNFEVREIL